MSSVIDVANLALLRVGQQSIASLDEDSQEARACTRLVEPVRRAMLREFAWPWAITTAVLAQLDETPADWSYSYQLPPDCLRVLSVVSSTTTEIESEVRGRTLLCDEDTVTLLYLQDQDDPSYWDPLFIEAMSYRLAADLASILSGATQSRDVFLRMYEYCLRKAKAAAASEIRKAYEPGRTFLEARA